jgi:hypothetical protein
MIFKKLLLKIMVGMKHTVTRYGRNSHTQAIILFNFPFFNSGGGISLAH